MATRRVGEHNYLTLAPGPVNVAGTDMDHIFFFYRNPA